jgi:hypothetical protein
MSSEYKKLIRYRSKHLRRSVPNILEFCYESQNRICDLCNKPIQDLVLAALDHSVPLIQFARDISLSLKEAVSSCNDPKNLRAAHSFCNNSKKDRTREEWFDKNLDKTVGTIKILSDEEIEDLRLRVGKGGRIRFKKHGDAFTTEARSRGGKTSGSNNVLNGHLASIRTKENQSKGGRRNVESGQLASIRTLEASIRGGRTQGRIAVESGQLASITTYETRAKGGRKQGLIQGRKNVESGQLASIRTPEHQSAAGKVGGRKAVDSGHLDRIRLLSSRKENQAKHLHLRWHVKRNLVNQNCNLCKGKDASSPASNS